jgi:hypothetical protein
LFLFFVILFVLIFSFCVIYFVSLSNDFILFHPILQFMFHLSDFYTFCFGGHRSPSAFDLGACQQVFSQLLDLSIMDQDVITSCSTGVPALAQAHFPDCTFFWAGAADYSGLGRAAFAARAAAMIQYLSKQVQPLFICFPLVACPLGLRPRRSWQSCGSGSWSEVALSIGLQVPTLVFLPSGVLPPSFLGAWSEVAAAPGGLWWFCTPPSVLF